MTIESFNRAQDLLEEIKEWNSKKDWLNNLLDHVIRISNEYIGTIRIKVVDEHSANSPIPTVNRDHFISFIKQEIGYVNSQIKELENEFARLDAN